mmetsp:Transcript_32849/g.83135  ORF Transcript_32849/g.83135 Transcript_32849/m.83135 type:complete len:278 (+) Transcript_32849:641-1474(+)
MDSWTHLRWMRLELLHQQLLLQQEVGRHQRGLRPRPWRTARRAWSPRPRPDLLRHLAILQRPHRVSGPRMLALTVLLPPPLPLPHRAQGCAGLKAPMAAVAANPCKTAAERLSRLRRRRRWHQPRRLRRPGRCPPAAVGRGPVEWAASLRSPWALRRKAGESKRQSRLKLLALAMRRRTARPRTRRRSAAKKKKRIEINVRRSGRALIAVAVVSEKNKRRVRRRTRLSGRQPKRLRRQLRRRRLSRRRKSRMWPKTLLPQRRARLLHLWAWRPRCCP